MLSPLSSIFIRHVLIPWAFWKVPPAVGIQIWDMLVISERDFLLGHSSKCLLPTRPYAGPLLVTSNLLGHFSVLGQAHDPTYYFGPLPLHIYIYIYIFVLFIFYLSHFILKIEIQFFFPPQVLISRTLQ